MTDDWEKYYDILYEEADKNADTAEVNCDEQHGQINPLYDTLRKIRHRYEDEKLIGEGGWKVIYRVHDTCANRDVALARPRPNVSGDSYDAFLREAHITAKLEHANIIKLFDMGVEENGTPFFTMEFKRGKSLLDRLREARDNDVNFPLEERLQIFLAICDAISYAHSRRVLHLDIKPENIQVGDFGEVQVCDWGLGEIVINRNDNVSDSDVLLDPDLYGDNGELRLVKGTPGFMAPEQKTGEPRTCQTDVYALGKTLAVLVAKKHIPALAAIITKATAHAPADRYNSVQNLRDDVHRFVTLHPTSVEPGGFAREAWLFIRRNQRSSVIAVMALFATVILSTYFLAELEVHRREQVVAQAQADRALSELAVTEQERQLANEEALRASGQANLATEMARAMIEGDHQKAYEGSMLLMNIMGWDPMNGEKSFEEYLTSLKQLLEKGTPNDALVRQQLGYAYFVAQRFDQAASFYEGLAVDPDLQSLIPVFQAKVAPNKFLELRDFRGLLIRLGEKANNPRPSLIEQMVAYDNIYYTGRRDALYRKIINVITALSAFNPEWPSRDTWVWNAESQSLELTGVSLTTLANTTATNQQHLPSLLQTLPLKSLTLRHTGVEDLSQVSSLNLWQLVLINTLPKSFEPLRQMKSLRFIKLDRPSLLEQARAQLGSHINIELIEPGN